MNYQRLHATEAAHIFNGLVQYQLNQMFNEIYYDMELLHNLSKLEIYFNVTFQGLDASGSIIGLVDFTAGDISQFGRFCQFA